MIWPKRIVRALSIVVSACGLAANFGYADRILIIEGASGDASYGERFAQAAQQWEDLATEANLDWTRVKDAQDELAPRDQIASWIEDAKNARPPTSWIVYLGHGSFGADGAKINLVGPDLSEKELSQALDGLESQLVFIHGGAASGPFLSALSGPQRIIITATRSGNEENYARFGELFARALRDERSDIDLDGRVSLLEAFVMASAAVETFYFEASRLTSEHALIDDNGDSLGTPADRFKGLRPKNPEGAEELDGRVARKLSILPAKGERLLTASQIEQRDALEAELDLLHAIKQSMPEDAYYEKVEEVLVKLSKIYLETGPES